MPELFLSCDWGTSRFRLRLAEIATGCVGVESRANDETPGVAAIAAACEVSQRPQRYASALESAIAALQSQTSHDLARLPVVISGMASSSLGWCELPYAHLPFALSGSAAAWKRLAATKDEDSPRDIWLLSGVRSANDVMRGEETEALGAWDKCAADVGDRDAVLILPGTHSKHLFVRKGAIVDFQTYMTGELFDVLSRHSVLRHSLSPGESGPVDLQNDAAMALFLTGVRLGSLRALSAALFATRTAALLSGCSPPECAAYLSGTLIGAELAGVPQLLRHVESALEQVRIVLCAGAALHAAYVPALEVLGFAPSVIVLPPDDVAQLAVRGQARILRHLLTVESSEHVR